MAGENSTLPGKLQLSIMSNSAGQRVRFPLRSLHVDSATNLTVYALLSNEPTHAHCIRLAFGISSPSGDWIFSCSFRSSQSFSRVSGEFGCARMASSAETSDGENELELIVRDASGSDDGSLAATDEIAPLLTPPEKPKINIFTVSYPRKAPRVRFPHFNLI